MRLLISFIYHQHLRRITYVLSVFFLITLLLVNSVGLVHAFSQDDVNSILNNTPFYEPSVGQCGGSSGDSGGSSTDGSTPGPVTWSSSVQPPYYLEEFVINVLQDIAQAEEVPTTDTVTQEHVVALVAWAWHEGGNIGNTNDFNLWNAGFLGSNYADLYVGGTGNSNGSETSFASFNDGVEGNTIVLTGSNQSRIGTVLSDPSSTAEEVLDTIANYNETVNNVPWAWGDIPAGDTPAEIAAFELNVERPAYLNSLLIQLTSTRADYAGEASTIIGPNQEDTNHVPVSDLTYTGGTANANPVSADDDSDCVATTTSASCQNSGNTTTGNAAILCEAEKYAGIYYTYGGGHDGYTNFRQACPEASISGAVLTSSIADPGPCSTDCSGLVSVAVDAVFNQAFDWTVGVGTGVMSGSPSEWQSIPISQAQPGDIVTYYTATDGHVEIFESQSNGMVTSFGQHETGTQASSDTEPASFWNGGAWRYVGPGAN